MINDLQSDILHIRKSALRTLIQFKMVSDNVWLQLLKDRFTKDSDPEIRAVARKYYDIFVGQPGISDTKVEHRPASINKTHEKILKENTEPSCEILEKSSPEEKIEYLSAAMEGKTRISKETLHLRLQKEKDVFVIASLISLIGKTGDQEDGKVLIPFLRHSDYRVRANAVDALGAIKTEEHFNEIVRLLQDNDARVKSNAARALSESGLEKALKTLEKMVCSGKVNQIASAIYALERFKHPKAKDLLDVAKSNLESVQKSDDLYSLLFNIVN
ncbi:MAG: HEAT repeat domain-containing protein [Candidatus Wallbacteria bacterium]|nr:HEAT repeat domain-containing protein [Candidatus Wallbacteria bacterium]